MASENERAMNELDDYLKGEISDHIFRISMKVGNRSTLIKDVRPLLKIDFECLENELESLPAILFFYEALLAEQKSILATLDTRKEFIKSQLTSQIKNKAEEDDVRLSDAKMKNLISGDEKTLQITCEIIQEQRNFDRLRAVVNCLMRKSEHLRSLAGFKRDERTRS